MKILKINDSILVTNDGKIVGTEEQKDDTLVRGNAFLKAITISSEIVFGIATIIEEEN